MADTQVSCIWLGNRLRRRMISFRNETTEGSAVPMPMIIKAASQGVNKSGHMNIKRGAFTASSVLAFSISKLVYGLAPPPPAKYHIPHLAKISLVVPTNCTPVDVWRYSKIRHHQTRLFCLVKVIFLKHSSLRHLLMFTPQPGSPDWPDNTHDHD